MRFSSYAVVAALPALASAQEALFGQYKAQFDNIVSQMGSYIPNPAHFDPVAALEAKVGAMKMSVLTLNNWRQTLYEPVAPGATKPEEWWVLITGGNKTCYGHCGTVEKAFNESATKLSLTPGSPHMAYLNCDHQPILCNSWSAAAGNLWAFDMLPSPAPVEIYKRRLNLTTTTADELVALHAAGNHDGFTPLDSWFHPFEGKAAELGVAVPFGYVLWFFNLIPNWLFMLVVSFASRSMMSNRMQNPGDRRAPAAGAAPAAQ